MKNNLIYSLTLLVLVAMACKQSPKTDDKSADEKAAAEKEAITNRCIDSVKARIALYNQVKGYTLDSFAVVSIDSATEKMAQQHDCNLLEKEKLAYDRYVELQKNTVEAAKKVHPSLGAQEQTTLKIAEGKQEVATEKWLQCKEAANTQDSVHYTYTRITTMCIRTTPKGKDTVTNPYFVGKDFNVKPF
jgi:hypothetical protein